MITEEKIDDLKNDMKQFKFMGITCLILMALPISFALINSFKDNPNINQIFLCLIWSTICLFGFLVSNAKVYFIKTMLNFVRGN